MNETITFNGINSRTYGVYISGEGVYNAPERSVEMVTIPGRNGNLALDQGRFENITVTYPAFMWADNAAAFASDLAAFRNAILSQIGYFELTDDYHADEFRLAIYKSGLDVDPATYNTAGEFSLEFDCKPQRFLYSGTAPHTFTADGTITNPERFASKPLIEVVGYGTLIINGYSFVITGNAAQDIFIDCETLEAYSMAGGIVTPMNNAVSIGNQSPVLSPGVNTITLSGNISSVSITPRWWRV